MGKSWVIGVGLAIDVVSHCVPLGAAPTDGTPPAQAASALAGAVSHTEQPQAPAKGMPDFSTPKKAAQTFFAAMQAEDGETMKRCSVTLPAKAVGFRDAMIRYFISVHHFYRAATARFGNDPAWTDWWTPDTRYRGDFAARWKAQAENAEVQVTGQRACLRWNENEPCVSVWPLEKEGKDWKLFFIECEREDVANAGPDVLGLAASAVESGSKAVERMALGIELGQINTAVEAGRAMREAEAVLEREEKKLNSQLENQ